MQGWFSIQIAFYIIHRINRPKKRKNTMIILIDAEKNISKSQCPFMIETLNLTRNIGKLP